ncbi:MAG: DUF1836 domain-containing protein [Clostridia bacterium]|nr:DUF1836 domain-containing protein [Clostridia bacterium]
MCEHKIPGTNIPMNDTSSMFDKFIPLIKATNGLTLSQVCAITGLEPSTIQNWVKRGFVARPVQKKYHERQLARILLISSLRDAMKIDSIGELMALVNGSADDESDDIIPEERMYDYFCMAITKAESGIPAVEEIPSLVRQTLADYAPPHPGAADRLADALCVMVYAYCCAHYKKEADALFEQMKQAAI